MVLHVLHIRLDGSARTSEQLRSLSGISKKMLTQTLRDMEAAGLVTRRIYRTIPAGSRLYTRPSRPAYC